MSELGLVHVSKNWGPTAVLVDVTLRLREGQMVALVGNNGSGKTTLLAVLGGQLRPDKGSVCIDSKKIDVLSPSARSQLGVARMFQDSKLWEGMSVAEHLALVKETRRPMRVSLADLAQACGIDRSTFGRSHEELPLLDRRRVELCLALYGARFLLCDELGAGLSLAEAKGLYQVVRQALDLNWIKAALMVEHRHVLLEQHCTEYVQLERGRLRPDSRATPTQVPELITSMV